METTRRRTLSERLRMPALIVLSAAALGALVVLPGVVARDPQSSFAVYDVVRDTVDVGALALLAGSAVALLAHGRGGLGAAWRFARGRGGTVDARRAAAALETAGRTVTWTSFLAAVVAAAAPLFWLADPERASQLAPAHVAGWLQDALLGSAFGILVGHVGLRALADAARERSGAGTRAGAWSELALQAFLVVPALVVLIATYRFEKL